VPQGRGRDGSLLRGGATDLLQGEWQPHRIVVLELPSRDVLRRLCASPEY
jgi:uncharacterized protein (DUF1330 family)